MISLNPNNPAYNSIIIYTLIIVVIYLMKPSFLYNDNKEIDIYKSVIIALIVYFIFYIASLNL
jgi:hypothetical protein